MRKFSKVICLILFVIISVSFLASASYHNMDGTTSAKLESDGSTGLFFLYVEGDTPETEHLGPETPPGNSPVGLIDYSPSQLPDYLAVGIAESHEITDVLVVDISEYRADIGMSFYNVPRRSAARSNGTWFVRPGDVLRVNSLTWTPTGQGVRVGIRNVQTGRIFYRPVAPGGSLINTNFSFPNAPAGEYYVVVWNEIGPAPISGSMNFRWN